MSHGAHNSAHSANWKGPTSRGARLGRKLGRRLSLGRLAQLLDTSHPGRVVIAMDDEKPDPAPAEQSEKPAEEKPGGEDTP